MYRKVRTVLTNMYSLGNLIIYNSRKEFLYYNALCSKEVGVVTSQGTTDSVVVSITTYGKRIYEVHLVIESLLLQTLPPYKIILWLAEDEFNEQNIPLVLKKQASRGLEINFCKDIKSYKKLIPTIEKYPGSIIITVDDDVLYAYDFIENLYKEYLSDKNCIYCYRAHKIVLDKTGIPLPYSKWKHNYQGNEKMMELFPTGVGGILYPPNCFHKDILRSDLFTQLAPSADDIWFKAMTLLQKIPCKKVPNIHPNIDLTENQDMALCHKNVGKQKNDEQLKQTFNYYNLWDSLKKSL